MLDHFKLLARYNHWANEKLYRVAGQLTEEELNRDLAAFFTSVLGTLNHLLVGDYAWMRRFEQAGPQPESLDQILHDNFVDLKEARWAADERLVRLVDHMNEKDLEGRLISVNWRGETCDDLKATALCHLFNHQTHHRGQCHQLLSRLGMTPPDLDLIYFSRE